MRYLKGFDEKLRDNDKIHYLCKLYDIKNYTINEDGSVDVNGSVDLRSNYLTKIPIKFGKVTGTFNCLHNNLESLEGCPREVGGHFNCSRNRLTSLIGGPEIVGLNFDCSYNRLTSLDGCPAKINILNCSCNNLISLTGCPDITLPNWVMKGYCDDNPVSVIINLFKDCRLPGRVLLGDLTDKFIDKINYIYTDLHLGDGWTIQGDIIEQIAEELDIELPYFWKDRVEGKGYKII